MSDPGGAAFERRNLARWKRFRSVASEYASSGRVPPERIVEFARAYRDVAADLSAARSRGCRPEIRFELNALVALGHGVVYGRRTAGAGGSGLRGVARFLLSGFPALVRREGGLFLLSVGLFVVPALLGWWETLADGAFVHRVFPSLDSVIRPDGTSPSGALNPMPVSLASFYLTHNFLVAVTSFAGGVLLGVGSAWFLAMNGLVLGVLAGHFEQQGHLANFWPQVLPHGVTELLACIVASQAGMLLARALWRPGPWSRRDALVRAGRDAGSLMGGVAFLVAISAVVESFLTRSIAENGPRNLFAAAAAVAVGAWFAAAPRSAAPPSGPGSGSPPRG